MHISEYHLGLISGLGLASVGHALGYLPMACWLSGLFGLLLGGGLVCYFLGWRSVQVLIDKKVSVSELLQMGLQLGEVLKSGTSSPLPQARVVGLAKVSQYSNGECWDQKEMSLRREGRYQDLHNQRGGDHHGLSSHPDLVHSTTLHRSTLPKG